MRWDKLCERSFVRPRCRTGVQPTYWHRYQHFGIVNSTNNSSWRISPDNPSVGRSVYSAASGFLLVLHERSHKGLPATERSCAGGERKQRPEADNRWPFRRQRRPVNDDVKLTSNTKQWRRNRVSQEEVMAPVLEVGKDCTSDPQWSVTGRNTGRSF